MNVTTSDDFTGVQATHFLSKAFIVLGYADGAISTIPNNFFRNWMDEEATVGTFVIGKGSGIGVGSIAKYDGEFQKLVPRRSVKFLRVWSLQTPPPDDRRLSH